MMTNIDILNDLAKDALRHKTAFVNKVTAYRDFQHNALIELLKKADLYNCYVIYKYEDMDGNLVFNGECVNHRDNRNFSLEAKFLTDDEDYFSYLINEVFPKMKRGE